MMLIGPFVIIAVIGTIVALSTTSAHRHVPGTPGTAGALSPVPGRATTRVPAYAEALGYLGGILAVAGLTTAVAQWWDGMLTVTRLMVTGLAAVVLVVAGFLVPERDDRAFARLRGFLWLAGTAAAGAFGAVLAVDAFDWHGADVVALTIAGFVLAVGGALWAWRERPLQQFTTLVAASVVVGTLVGMTATRIAAGAAVWVLGVGLVVAGLRMLTPLPRITVVVGAATAVVGSFITIPDDDLRGLLFVIATGIAVMALAVSPRLEDIVLQRLLAAVGVLTLLQTVPPALVHFAHRGAVVTGVVVWLGGVALLAVARRGVVRVPLVLALVGGLLVLGGPALTGVQSVAVATTFGLVSAATLVAIGTLPGNVLMSLIGSAGLLVNVPWAIAHFFPGEGRVPLLVTVSGLLIIGVAVLLARSGKRLRAELGRPERAGTALERAGVDVDAEEQPPERLVHPR